jgi:hypothetical protein
MSEPIILDGGAQMITITLPASFKKKAKVRGKFSISPESKDAPFRRIVITNSVTGKEVFNLSLDDNRPWKIEIK